MTTATKIQETLSNEKNQYDFIKDEFTASDAQEIMEELIHKKINFYKLKNLTTGIQYGVEDKIAAQRIDELKLFKKSIEDQFHNADKQFKKVKITSQIKIELI